MSLKGRLARLGPGAPVAPGERPAPSPQPSTPAEASGPAPGVLDELRARMAALLNREPPRPHVEAKVDLSELPFERVDTPGGPLTLRRLSHGPGHHVGRIPVDSARQVAPALLSLLALDPALARVDASRALYLDTETTGLGGAGTLAFLVGLAFFDAEGRLVLEQLLLSSPAEEAALIAHVHQRIEAASLLVTFNGKSFDLPLLEGRALMNAQPRFAARPHLDLLHVARRLHKARLGGCRLKLLEAEVLGFDRRDDDVAGADIAPLYGHFLRTGNGELLRPVVDHNAWDVVSMAALVGLYGEPLGLLHPRDLLGVAETARRAGAYDEARNYADASWAAGAGPDALWARARIEKARGDKARALLDFELLSREVDDPAVRLELCKLYEHHEKDFRAALEVLGRGLGEDDERLAKRRARLEQKQRKKSTIPGGRSRRR